VFKLPRVPKFLGAALAAILLVTFSAGAHAATAEEITKQIAALKAALAAFDGKGELADEIGGLRKALLTFETKAISQGNVTYFTQHSSDIQALLEDKATRFVIQTDKDAQASVLSLLDSLDKLTEEAVVDARFTDLLTKLTKLINADTSNRVVLSEQLRLEPSKSIAAQARKDFDLAWAAITEDYRIHVIGSSFGDLEAYWSEGRRCDSWSAMRAQCERLTECKLPTGTPFDQIQMCGFDPAPLVDPRDKGVVVRYTCVRGGNDTWDRVAQYPGTDPVTGKPWLPQNIYQALLRSSTMSIRCPIPKPAATSNATKP
jgi:hypothetical protein